MQIILSGMKLPDKPLQLFDVAGENTSFFFPNVVSGGRIGISRGDFLSSKWQYAFVHELGHAVLAENMPYGIDRNLRKLGEEVFSDLLSCSYFGNPNLMAFDLKESPNHQRIRSNAKPLSLKTFEAAGPEIWANDPHTLLSVVRTRIWTKHLKGKDPKTVGHVFRSLAKATAKFAAEPELTAALKQLTTSGTTPEFNNAQLLNERFEALIEGELQ